MGDANTKYNFLDSLDQDPIKGKLFILFFMYIMNIPLFVRLLERAH
jgi:hypothetical protein